MKYFEMYVPGCIQALLSLVLVNDNNSCEERMDVPCSNYPQMIHPKNTDQRKHSTGRRKGSHKNSQKQLEGGGNQDLAQAKTLV